MAHLSDLRRPDGASKRRKRVGRGPGSGSGKTSGRGHKGHKARSGGSTPLGFEGGQMPIQRRLPKRGFNNTRFRKVFEFVNLRDLDRISEDTITVQVLAAHRLVAQRNPKPIKILGEGDLSRAVTVQAHAISTSARSKIEAAGGTVELLES
jgi:large subunit ribosomal protein L15